MKLYTGGIYQGKLDYCLSKIQGPYLLLDGEDMPMTCEELQIAFTKQSIIAKQSIIINHLHLWVRRCLAENRDPEEEIRRILGAFPDADMICDDIGCGVVPVDPEERIWREKTGRIVLLLAGEAESVERLVCGIAQKLK